MKKLIKVETRTAIILYIFADLICVGAGMGVPIFCILFGFPLGWYITKKVSPSLSPSRLIYYRILNLSILAALFTFLMMAVIWGSAAMPMLFNPEADISNFGHPFILYEPKASLVGWLILMIIVSPFLQLLTTIFASFITLMNNELKNKIEYNK